MLLGEKIKELRKKKGLTIKELSDKTNLSIGFISNLERNINSPTIHNLEHICSVLNVDLIEILSTGSESNDIVLKDHRDKIFESHDDKIIFESLLKGKKELNALSITIQGDCLYSHMCWGHNYDEIGIVISGVLEIEVDSKLHVLHKGDSIYIPKFTTHKYLNPSSECNVTYWFSPKI